MEVSGEMNAKGIDTASWALGTMGISSINYNQNLPYKLMLRKSAIIPHVKGKK
jgi:hypothetical protein